MQRHLFPTLALALSVAVGCGGRDDNLVVDPDLDAMTKTFPTFASEATLRTCAVMTCAIGLAPSACASLEGGTGGQASQIQEAVTAGRITYDQAKAKACLLKLGAAAGNCWGEGKSFDFEESELDCIRGVLTGTVANGESCEVSEECAEGFCNASAQQCPGTCEAFRTAGGECTEDEQCAAGLSCEDETCVAPGAVDEDCSSRPCAAGLTCDGETSTCVQTGTPVAQGEACDDATPCANGLYCKEGAAGSTCEPRLAAGATCEEPSFFGESRECASRQVCAGAAVGMAGSSTGTCATPQDEGGPCTPVDASAFFASTGCFLGLVCDPATNKCAEPPAVGQDCIVGSCASGAWCDDTNKCVAAKADGASCQDDSECLSDNCDLASETCAPAEDEEVCNP